MKRRDLDRPSIYIEGGHDEAEVHELIETARSIVFMTADARRIIVSFDVRSAERITVETPDGKLVIRPEIANVVKIEAVHL